MLGRLEEIPDTGRIRNPWNQRANIELPVAQLLYHFDWKLPRGAKPDEPDMSESFSATMKKRVNLYLAPTLYTHLPIKKQE
ncbi:hypothetical protein GIB67_032382 [Kingdonia uniflora]|uniref:Cytochrome P450 n=1 Tax=Kingdonia uniflora TaxID=39325 RepID=A0A7J7MIZ9_9MAGN|nr:hypothetical protein GIB67_032382 [Kingdonia uniflora]